MTSMPDRLFTDHVTLTSLLVEFFPGAKPSLLDVAEIEQELSALLAGRRVDLRTAEDLSRYFRDEVLREVEVQYESA